MIFWKCTILLAHVSIVLRDSSSLWFILIRQMAILHKAIAYLPIAIH